jgi:hypothetical protein
MPNCPTAAILSPATAFTDEEEAEVKYTKVVPYLLATTLKKHGALHQPAPNWSENVVTDGCSAYRAVGRHLDKTERPAFLRAGESSDVTKIQAHSGSRSK